MGQSKSIDLPNSGAGSSSATVSSKSRWWLWVLALGVVALGGWYYRNSKSASEAADPSAPAAAGKGRRLRRPKVQASAAESAAAG